LIQASGNGIESLNLPQLPRVVTTASRSAAPPRVSARAHNLYPINLAQGDLLDMGLVNNAMASANTNVPMMNAVLHLTTGKEIQYKDIMKHPILGPQYKQGVLS
jgi:hypothetical protein